MAEAFLHHLAGDRFEASSAGFEPTCINPLVIEVMREEGFDLSDHQTKSVFELYKQGKLYRYIITVCDESTGQRCPVFPGIAKRLHWSFDDPASFTGSHEEKLALTRKVRDEIMATIQDWLSGPAPAAD
ncbi:MAG: arsenate reductase ArsC [Deltaproteobacteria bacterium]|nr:arsenate reductase ArsC [Deltaproteobacteria bacterium]MBF0523486.1 arsenate reductase ArsC [Deltaproteobacteria bacterium]